MKNKVVAWTNIVYFALIIVSTILLMLSITSPYIIKTIDSVLFVLCGATNLTFLYVYKKPGKVNKAIVLVVGLILACVGDILIISNFVLGAIFFAVGHIFFVVYFCLLQKPNYIDFFIGISIFIVSLLLILFLPIFNFGNFMLVIIFYAFIISFMLGKAIGNYLAIKTNDSLVVFIGAMLFFFSDLMLVFDNFTDLGEVFGYLCLATYYIAEFLLAYSVYNVDYTIKFDKGVNTNTDKKSV